MDNTLSMPFLGALLLHTFCVQCYVKHNCIYFLILIVGKSFRMSIEGVYKKLKKYNIYSCRYLYPLVSNMSFYDGLYSTCIDNFPQANMPEEQLTRLPIYSNLSLENIECVREVIKSS